MRILALYPALPYPGVSGAKLRGLAVLDILAANHKVLLVSFLSREDSPSSLPAWNTYTQFEQPPVLVIRRSEEALSAAGERLRARLPKTPMGMPESLEAFDSPAMWNRLAVLQLGEFNAIHVRYMSMAPYALALKRAAPHLRLIIDLDDIVSALFCQRIALPRGASQVRMFLWELKELLRIYAFERGPLRCFDSVWVCSKLDDSRLRRRLKGDQVLVVENVVDAKHLAALGRREMQPMLLFVGNFDYAPNTEGAEFFLEQVWPSVRAAFPEAELFLVGRNSQQSLLHWNGKAGVSVAGIVEAVEPYLERATVAIAPIFKGSGTRLKILEALGAGLPVVSTTLGAEGIAAEQGIDLLIANTAEAFANQCIRLIQDPSLRAKLGEAGRRLVRDKYDLAMMSKTVLACYRSFES